MISRIKKIDAAQQIVAGEVFAPNVIDSHGEMMLKEDIETMAHRFMKLGNVNRRIDQSHDNVPQDAYPVESFIARKGDPDFTEGAWVLAVKIVDEKIWEQVVKGELNGFSFEAMVTKVATVVEMEIEPECIRMTEPGGDDGHTHLFYARINDDGKITEGRTSTVNGHSHEIKRGTATEESAGHAHRIFV
jgi:hypothetical protein